MGSKFRFKNRRAFTIAETLITIGIIGIIAVILLPILLGNVTQNVFNQEQDLIVKKLRASTDLMRVNSSLMDYATNDSFVDEFQKYIKFAKRCNSSNLQDCFVSNFQTASEENIALSSLTTGKKMGQLNNTSPIVGLILVNGTSMLLAYNPDCKIGEASTSYNDTTSCMALAYDVNGFAQPNKIGKDISLLNATITNCDGIYISGLCVAPSDTTYTAPYDLSWEDWDYWSGAYDACNSLGMRLPSTSELTTIYQNKSKISGLKTSYYWSDNEIGFFAYALNMSTGTLETKARTFNINARCVK